MGQRPQLPDGVEQAGPRLVVGGIHQGDVRVFPKGPLHRPQVRRAVIGQLQLHVGQTVVPADVRCPGAVGPVVDDEGPLALGQQGVEAHVHAQRARPAEQHRGVPLRVPVYYPHQILPQPRHQAGELLFAGADIGRHLGQLHGGRGGGRPRIQQDIPSDFHADSSSVQPMS